MRKFYRLIAPFLLILLLLCSRAAYSGESPARIVSLSPNLTQIVWGLGKGDNIVGVTIFSEIPPETKSLPKIGGWVNPNHEAILALKPDIVLLMKDQDTMFGDKLRRLGLNTRVLTNNQSIENIYESIAELGQILGCEDNAQAMVKEIQEQLKEIRFATSQQSPKRVLIVIGRNPGTLEDIYVVGSNNYIDELLTLAGGINVVDHKRTALKITKEAIMDYDPEIIIEINHNNEELTDRIEKIWGELSGSKAVARGQLYVLPSTLVLHPSQRITLGAKVLADIIHPELNNNNAKTD